MKKQGIPSSKPGPKMQGAIPAAAMILVEHAARLVQTNIGVVMKILGATEIKMSRQDFEDMEGRYSISQTPGVEPHSVVIKLTELPKEQARSVAPSNLMIPGRDF